MAGAELRLVGLINQLIHGSGILAHQPAHSPTRLKTARFISPMLFRFNGGVAILMRVAPTLYGKRNSAVFPAVSGGCYAFAPIGTTLSIIVTTTIRGRLSGCQLGLPSQRALIRAFIPKLGRSPT